MHTLTRLRVELGAVPMRRMRLAALDDTCDVVDDA
jgi:hypothetical protein